MKTKCAASSATWVIIQKAAVNKTVTILLSPRVSRDNLFNTNEQFDYGGFRELMEAQSQTSTSATLFAYRFRDPGVYVFYLSTDVNKKFVSDLVLSYKQLHVVS